MPTCAINPDSPEGDAILALFADITTLPAGTAQSCPVTDLVCAWFARLGLDTDADPSTVTAQLRRHRP